MSDALWYSEKIDEQEKAYHNYLQLVITYLHEPSEDNYSQCLNQINNCAETFSNRFSKYEMKAELDSIAQNDLKAWRELNSSMEGSFSQYFPELLPVFTEAAKSRNIGHWQWII